MNDKRMFGILFVFFGADLATGFGAPPVWKEAAISLNPVGWGFIGAGTGAVAIDACCGGAEEKGLGGCCCCCWNCCWNCWGMAGMGGAPAEKLACWGCWPGKPVYWAWSCPGPCGGCFFVGWVGSLGL